MWLCVKKSFPISGTGIKNGKVEFSLEVNGESVMLDKEQYNILENALTHIKSNPVPDTSTKDREELEKEVCDMWVKRY